MTAYPEDGDAYPEILGFVAVEFSPPGSAPRPGDRLLSYGASDLRGLGPLPVLFRAWQAGEARPDGLDVPLRYRRGEVIYESRARLPRNHLARGLAFISGIDAILAVLVLWRGRQKRSARAFSFAAIVHAILYCPIVPKSESMMYAGVFIGSVAFTLLGPLVLRSVLLVPEETAPKSRWPYWLIWSSALCSVFYWQYWLGFYPHTPSVETRWMLSNAFYATFSLIGLGLLVRNYAKASPIGRRQLRWSLFGLAVAVPALVGALIVGAAAPDRVELILSLHILTVAAPISVAIGIAWFQLFDIDRIISTTTAYAISLITVLAVGLLLLKQMAGRLGPGLGTDVSTLEFALEVGAAVIAIPLQRYVRPWVEGIFFKERVALREGMAQLLRDVGTNTDARQLLRHVGERLEALLQPRGCVVYGVEDAEYTPAFARGQAPIPSIPATDPLVAALSQRSTPLIDQRWAGQRSSQQLTPFERATLDTLNAVAVVPVVHGSLVAFLCLGRKWSGDVYTATDLALLSALAERIGAAVAVTAQAPQTTSRESPSAMAPDATTSASENGGAYVFRKEGGYWTIAFNGGVARVKDAKGVQYVAYLLRHPFQEIPALHLVAGSPESGNGNGGAAPYSGTIVLDAKAKADYKRRIAELREELADAERLNDLGRAERTRAEIDFITQELSAAIGLRGVDRRTGSDAERARSAVTKSIKRAIESIRIGNPSAGRHLANAIRTGHFCTYRPDPGEPSEWQS